MNHIEANTKDFSKTLGDPTKRNFSVNHIFNDCLDEKIILRTSSYASFSNSTVPEKAGKIIGIFSIFRQDKQITIRSLEDMVMNDTRCDFSPKKTPNIGNKKEKGRSCISTW